MAKSLMFSDQFLVLRDCGEYHVSRAELERIAERIRNGQPHVFDDRVISDLIWQKVQLDRDKPRFASGMLQLALWLFVPVAVVWLLVFLVESL